jgi:hypothetical protein
MAKRVYLGPSGRQPVTVSDKTVAGAYLPATFVTEGASTLTQATAPTGLLRLLANRDFYSEGHFTTTDPLLTAYASGDTGVAYVLETGQEYQAAAAAATYTYAQELTVGAAGRLVAAASTNVVVGFAKEAGAKSAGDMLAFEVARPYVKD